MEENGLVKHQLSFFDRMRKRFYLRKMTTEKAAKYTDLPEALKYDEEVIRTIVDTDVRLINEIPFVFAQKLVLENPDLINEIENIENVKRIITAKPELINTLTKLNMTQKILEENPELFDGLNEELMLNMVFNTSIPGDKSFASRLPVELQKKILREDAKYTMYQGNPQSGRYEPSKFWGERKAKAGEMDLSLLSDEAILEIAREDVKKYKSSGEFKWGRIFDLDLKKMSLSAQIKLITLDPRYMVKVTDEALDAYVQDNPILLDQTPVPYRMKYAEAHRDRLSELSLDTQQKFIDSKKYQQDSVRGIETSYVFDVRDFRGDPEGAKKRLVKKGFMTHFWGRLTELHVTDIRDDEFIWEMGKFNPDLIAITFPDYSHRIDEFIRAGKLCQSFYDHVAEKDPNGPVAKYLETFAGDPRSSDYRYNSKRDGREEREKINKLSKFILNDDILEKVSQEEMMDYVDNPTNEKLAEIVRKAYGDKAARIILDRPMSDLENIPNFYIFHPTIIENFGIGAVHACMAYEMNASAMLSEFARNPEMLARYKEFKGLSGEIFEDTAVDLESSVRVFAVADDLIKSLNGRPLNEEQRRMLEIAILDAKSDVTLDMHNALPFPKTVAELDGYEARRNKIFDEAIQKLSDPDDVKEMICQKYFGMRYYGEGDHAYLDSPSAIQMCNFYHLHDFVNDPKVKETGRFTQDDMDALELLDIIREIRDPEILKRVAEELSKSREVINPAHYNALKKSIPLMYSQEMVGSLTTIEDAEKMVEEGQEGISIREEDGIKIVTLKGTDFKAFVSNPYMDNSGFISIKEPMQIPRVWQEVEGGISTFSGCLIDGSTTEEIHAIDKTRPNLGFYSVNPEQIVGMGYTDIHVSHSTGRVRPSTAVPGAVSFDFSDELLDKTAERFYGQGDSDVNFHHYDEVAASRRTQKLGEIEEGTHGGKTNPDFLFVYGAGKGSHAIEMAKKFGIDVIYEYDEEAYKSKRFEIYRQRKAELRGKETQEEPKKDSELVSDIKEIAKGDDDDGR